MGAVTKVTQPENSSFLAGKFTPEMSARPLGPPGLSQ
jgi:hypothetical protein